MERRPEPRTMRVIIVYKAIRGAALLLASIVLGIALLRGEGDRLHEMAVSLRDYATHRISIEVAELLLKFATPGRLVLTTTAIGLDGVVGLVEAWLLHRGDRWAIWLVVTASSALVPWEIYELVTHPRPFRVVLLVVNILVVIYLGVQASKHVAHRRAAASQ